MTPRSACYAVLASVAWTVACLPGPFGPAVLMGSTFLHLALRHVTHRVSGAAVAALAALGVTSVAAHAVAPLSPWLGVVAAVAWAVPFAAVGACAPTRPGWAVVWTSVAWTSTEVGWGHAPLLGRFATPFLTLASGWVDTPVVTGSAWIGSSGLTLATLLVGGVLATWTSHPLRATAASAIVTVATVAVTTVVPWPAPAPSVQAATTVRLVQPNVSRQELAAMPLDEATLARHRRFLRDHLDTVADGDWWVASESTIPWPLARDGADVDATQWADVLPFRGVGWFGAPTVDALGNIRNGVVAWRDGTATVVADKSVRVPWLEDALVAGDGTTLATVPVGRRDVRTAALVCFEAVFPHVVRAAASRAAEVLIVVANDAYAGEGPLPALHLRMVRLRAAEMGVPLVFVQNTGPSAVVDARGLVVGSLSKGVRGSTEVAFDARRTPWAPRRRGDVLGPLAWCVTVLLALVRMHRWLRKGVRPLAPLRVAGSPTT